MKDICNFLPPQNHKSDLEFFRFAYVANIKKIPQPIVYSVFSMNIVFKGTGVFKFDDKEFPLKSGDIFFTFPKQSFSIEPDNDFTFLYISFDGYSALPLLNSLNINKENCVYSNPENILTFWLDSIKRINDINANILTESVFMYTLSFIDNRKDKTPDTKKDKFDSILEYIYHNYTSNDMSLKKVADIFFYSEKYLSSLFAKKTGLKFSLYLNKLRTRHAIFLIKNGMTDIAEIADKCGYTDQFYFSKVFKKNTDRTPSEYIKSIQK